MAHFKTVALDCAMHRFGFLNRVSPDMIHSLCIPIITWHCQLEWPSGSAQTCTLLHVQLNVFMYTYQSHVEGGGGVRAILYPLLL